MFKTKSTKSGRCTHVFDAMFDRQSLDLFRVNVLAQFSLGYCDLNFHQQQACGLKVNVVHLLYL